MCPYNYYDIMRKSKEKKVLRYQMVMYALAYGKKATARYFKTTKKTVKKWLKRWGEEGWGGLEDKSKRPHNSPKATPEKEKEKLVKLKKKYKRIGAEQIKILEDIPISPRTMRKIWREKGISSRKRRKKHVVKQNLREMKRKWRFLEQITEDTKYLTDIPEYWIQMKQKRLPQVQYTARDVTTGMQYLAFGDERSLTYARLFAKYLNRELQKRGADLSKTRRQTDNGSEYIGSWQTKDSSAYTKEIETVSGQIHVTIFPGAHTFQADVETVHNLIEMEFYEIETFKNREDFLNKAYSYQLFFNLERPNTYKENKTPWQLAKEKNPDLNIEVATIPPVFLEDLLKSELDFLHQRGYHVYSVP